MAEKGHLKISYYPIFFCKKFQIDCHFFSRQNFRLSFFFSTKFQTVIFFSTKFQTVIFSRQNFPTVIFFSTKFQTVISFSTKFKTVNFLSTKFHTVNFLSTKFHTVNFSSTKFHTVIFFTDDWTIELRAQHVRQLWVRQDVGELRGQGILKRIVRPYYELMPVMPETPEFVTTVF